LGSEIQHRLRPLATTFARASANDTRINNNDSSGFDNQPQHATMATEVTFSMVRTVSYV